MGMTRQVCYVATGPIFQFQNLSLIFNHSMTSDSAINKPFSIYRGCRPGSKSNLKFQKKLEFYAKVKGAVSSLSAQKTTSRNRSKQRSRQKKLKAYNLSSLSEFLPELKGPTQQVAEDDLNLNCKSRPKLILKEGKQFSNVLNHAAFQSDPLFAIHQHLQSTQPVVEQKTKKKLNKNGSMKKKEKESNASAQAMDMSFY